MLTAADVSVIIPTRNALPLLQRTLTALERQDVGAANFETIVVDDASSDGTEKWLRAYTGSLRLKTVVLKENAGRAAARNIAAENASGRLLLMMDGDMEFAPDLIAGHLRSHNQTDRKLALLGRVRYDRKLGHRGYARYIETRGAAKLPPGAPLPGRYFISSHASLPRELFIGVGGFDDRFKVHGGEDLDFGMRLVKAGAEIRQARELTSSHLHIRPLRDVLKSAREYGRQNIPLLLEKHPELLQELKLDWVDDWERRTSLRRLLLAEPLSSAVTFVTGLLNGLAAPAIFYDYLLFTNYYRGYVTSLVTKN
jgi:glycosyltransferase involved in cell wall biosynthesis